MRALTLTLAQAQALPQWLVDNGLMLALAVALGMLLLAAVLLSMMMLGRRQLRERSSHPRGQLATASP